MSSFPRLEPARSKHNRECISRFWTIATNGSRDASFSYANSARRDKGTRQESTRITWVPFSLASTKESSCASRSVREPPREKCLSSIYIYKHSRSFEETFEEIPILQLLIGYPCPNGRYLIETISIKLFGSVCPKIYLRKKKKRLANNRRIA